MNKKTGRRYEEIQLETVNVYIYNIYTVHIKPISYTYIYNSINIHLSIYESHIYIYIRISRINQNRMDP